LAGVAAHLLERDPGQAHGALRDIKRVSGDALGELRQTLEVLRDPAQALPLGPGASLLDLEALTGGLRSAGATAMPSQSRSPTTALAPQPPTA
jgi:hypothetical protein